jgi:hypothetical protein
MLSRRRRYILIPAIILIPILLGMIPLNMAHRLASGGSSTHCKQAQLSNRCLFHSVISQHNDSTIVNLESTPVGQESTITLDIRMLDLDPIHSNTTIHSVPLRC